MICLIWMEIIMWFYGIEDIVNPVREYSDNKTEKQFSEYIFRKIECIFRKIRRR